MGAKDVPSGQRRNFVDGHQFDALTQRLTSTRLTRGGALRGMVAGALTLAGMARVADDASAGNKKKVCHCETGTCSTMKVKKSQRRTHLTEHQCDYQGACRSNITACAAAPILVNTNHLLDPCSGNGDCGANSGLACVAGVCLPLVPDQTCTNNGECSTGRCEGGVCVQCPLVNICQSETGAQCCAVGFNCDLSTGVCVL
jgi:hypothetical protein